MADDRTKPEPAEKTAAPPAPTGGGFIKTWLPLIIVVALMPALAFGMTRFVLLPQLQKGLGIQPVAVNATAETKPKAKKDGADAKRESVMLSKLLVNVAGTMGARYLLVSLSVVGTGSDFKGAMQEHDAQLRDMASGTLANKTLADLEKPGARNLIRTELINGFNNVLGDAVVQEIYLTEFAIQ
jgi:flagellar FliL protein